MTTSHHRIASTLRARAGLDDGEWARFVTFWLAVSLVFILLAAWRSEGYYHSDEQFQILEFAAAKLKLAPDDALPWEHELRMRPWIQPGASTLVVALLRRMGIDDPFVWARALRVGSGLWGWLALAGLALSCRGWIGDPTCRRAAVRMVCVFCVLPFLLVRTSSESLATSSFFLGLALFGLGAGEREAPPGRVLLLVGVFYGLAFELRYPVGLMVAGWFAWALVVRRLPRRELALVGTGIAAAVVLGAFVDRWGYGEWTFPPWNFVVENLRGDRAAERFGTLPLWGYLLLLVRTPFGPASALAALATGLAWIRHPRHVLTWSGAVFLLTHTLIAHKELRFLIPLVPAAAVSFGLALTPGRDRLDRLVRPLRGAGGSLLRKLLFTANGVALLVLCLVPPSPGVRLQRFVYRQRLPEILVLGPGSPYGPAGLSAHFYRPSGARVRLVTARELGEALHRSPSPLHVAVPEGSDPQLLAPRTRRCAEVFRSVPRPFHGLPGIRAEDRWIVFRCDLEPAPD